jgi:hypothetical protein
LSATSIAPGSSDGDGMFRIVHPFHPACGQQLPIVTIRQNWGENLLYYLDQNGRLVSIPARWTDRIEPDPVVTISAGRSPFRMEDLLELVRLVEALRHEVPHEH